MSKPRLLMVDDHIGDLRWLTDVVIARGYDIAVSTNEEHARRRLAAVKEGSETYALAIIDVMMAVKDLLDLASLDEQFFEDSKDTGIRLCRYARQELGLSPEELPIACLTVRDDEKVKQAMRELGIPLFNRAPHSPSESIRGFLEENLPRLEENGRLTPR